MDNKKLEELLLTVQKPGRYVGGEWNAIRKEWSDDKVKFLLAFPDLYEIGMSNLGMKILYGILNERSDCLCERVFAPRSDFEDVLRANKIALYSLESRKPINEFDIVGFSLAYELGYTNVLNMLDLGGVPIKSYERRDGDPLVIAGGTSCYNPEPMAEFIDAFVIGDGEEVVGEIVDAYKEGQGSRKILLQMLAKIKGVYVPSLYRVEYKPDMTIKKFYPQDPETPKRIEKRIVKNLDAAFYPTRQIVPNITIVHDRIALEIMRGCVHACSFCQSSATYRPCRQRSIEKILELARESYRATGFDEISLLSLSSGDYPAITELIEKLNNEFTAKAVSISVPSLRVEDVLRDLPGLISKVKKSGLTFAPEAGSARLRKVLNKNIDMDKLSEAALESFKKGWRRVKLYFMVGLPTENEEDIRGIGILVNTLSNLRATTGQSPAFVKASINAFVPKPHTPFQWESMDEKKTLEKKIGILKSIVKSGKTELDFHALNMSYLEAVLSRGNRKLSEVIRGAWISGARFDGWGDVFNFDRWLSAFEEAGVDHAFYAQRTIDHDEILPWDFIDVGTDKATLTKKAKDMASMADPPI